MRNFFGIFLLMFIFCSQLSAQKQLTLEDFFVDGTFRTKGVYGLRSMNDGEHYTVLENNGTRIVKYSYKTGLPVATLLDLKTLEDSPVSRIDDYTFNADESRILICTNKKPIYRRSFTADYYLFDFKNKEIIYLPRIRWTQDPKKLAIIRLNRHQNKMEVLLANAKVGTIVPLYREENKYYIDESNLDNLVFLDNGTQFVITSEKSGYMHLYLYDLNGRERQAITKGNFDIIDFYGYDPVRKLFYYSSYEESPLEKYIYSINEKGLKKKLTPVKGWNEASFSKNFNYYINVVSNTDTPPVTALYNAKGKQVRVLEDNKAVKEAVKAYNLAKPEFIQIPAADGKTMLNAWIMKPVNQEAGKKYPLLITQYSGPNSQQVKNNWSLSWLNYLAQEGYIVACIDPRGTAARGEEFRKCTYMQLGKLESDDMIAAAKWLATQPDVDVKNIGIWGWSYGGFMSSLCIMKGNDIFTTAIAVAPVTHYKYYDSIYTERYMRTPAENERGYEDNAPLNWADKLKGNLLICHGTADDNVHVQNTYELAERLVQANKQFDMAIYTNRNHSIFGGNTTLQLYNRFVKYLNEHMKR